MRDNFSGREIVRPIVPYAGGGDVSISKSRVRTLV